MNDARHHGYSSTPLSLEKLKILAVALFAALGALYFVGHGWYGLFDVDEAIFTQASVEMLESGDFIAPTYNSEPRYHKPPLIYWVQAASLHLFGTESRFGARLPSALFAFSTVLLLFMFCYKTLGQNRQSMRFALTAAAVFGLNLSWLVVARAATADAALNFFILASTLSLLSLLYVKTSLLRQIGTGFLLALGMLTKGPIALFIPGVVTLAVWLFKPDRSQSIRATNPIVIGAALIAGILPWFALMIATNGWDFFVEFWLVHNWGRFTGDLGNSHSSSGLYYLFVLLLGFFPWVIYLFLFAVNSLRPSSLMSALRSDNLAEALPYLGLLWGAIVVAFFSFSGTKLAHYIVPAYTGFSLFVAYGIANLPSHMHPNIHSFITFPLTLLLAFIFFILNPLLGMLQKVAAGAPSPFFNWLQRLFNFEWPPEDALTLATFSQDIHLNITPYMIAAVLILGVLHGFNVASIGFRHGIALMASTYALVLALIIGGVVPMVDQLTAQPLRHMAAEIKRTAEPSTHVFHMGLHKPSVRHLSRTPFTAVHRPKQLVEKLKAGDALVLYEERHHEDLIKSLPNTDTTKTIWQPPVCQGGFCVLHFNVTETN